MDFLTRLLLTSLNITFTLVIPFIMSVAPTASDTTKKCTLLYFSHMWIASFIYSSFPQSFTIVGTLFRVGWSLWCYHPSTRGSLLIHDRSMNLIGDGLDALLGFRSSMRMRVVDLVGNVGDKIMAKMERTQGPPVGRPEEQR